MQVANLRKARTQAYGRLAVLFSMLFMLGVAIADQADTDGNYYGRMMIAVPLLAAVFGQWTRVVLIALVNIFVSAGLGHFSTAAHNNHPMVYFSILAIISLLAVFVAWVREAVDQRLRQAMDDAIRLKALEEVASTDWLTGRLNRRGVVQAIESSEVLFRSVSIFDIDGLKKINDTYGHRIGDKFIQHVTARIASALKNTDVFGRWGGDEFVLLLPHELNLAAEIVDRVIKQVNATPLVVGEVRLEVRVSAGLSAWKRDEGFDQALSRADHALYDAKHRGGSCVVTFGDGIEL